MDAISIPVSLFWFLVIHYLRNPLDFTCFGPFFWRWRRTKKYSCVGRAEVRKLKSKRSFQFVACHGTWVVQLDVMNKDRWNEYMWTGFSCTEKSFFDFPERAEVGRGVERFGIEDVFGINGQISWREWITIWTERRFPFSSVQEGKKNKDLNAKRLDKVFLALLGIKTWELGPSRRTIRSESSTNGSLRKKIYPS